MKFPRRQFLNMAAGENITGMSLMVPDPIEKTRTQKCRRKISL
jgi:hypothetical protein